MGRWLPPGRIRLQGYKILELELKENRFRLYLENRHREHRSLILHGLVSLRDRGALGKGLGGIRIVDGGHLKTLTISGLRQAKLLVAEFMEAELSDSMPSHRG